MELTPKGVEIDIHQRFRKELHRLQLPKRITLIGNEMVVAVAKRLLTRHADYLEMVDNGEPVRLLSMERYGLEFLEGVMSDKYRPGFFLLTTIPEEAIKGYALRCGLPVVDEPLPEMAELVDKIKTVQPQTYFALRKSAERLNELIRDSNKK